MAVLCAVLAGACYFDYRKSRIPNWLCMVGLVCCFVNNYRAIGMIGAVAGMAQTLFFILIMFPLFRLGMLGAGDVKMLGVCCGWFSQEGVWPFLAVFLSAAGIVSMIHLIVYRDAVSRLQYLSAYIRGVCRGGSIGLYSARNGSNRSAAVRLAGPMLCGVILCRGGIV